MENEEKISDSEDIKYCLYVRKSTESDEKQALSIGAQTKEMTDLAEQRGLNILDIRQESHSAKDSGQRPIFNQIVADIKRGLFTGILTWAPDRLSRNAGDLGALVDLMDQGLLVEIRTYSQIFTNSPNEKFLLMILGSQAKLENDAKSENVKRGLRAKCQMGWRPGVPPVGYLHDKNSGKGEKKIFLDPERAPVIKEMFEKVEREGTSGRDLQEWLTKKKNFTQKTGNPLALSRIYAILKEPFYYGEFVYAGQLYKGSHDPLISKELFDKVQAGLVSVPKMKPGTKEFSFTKLIKCGQCGSGVTAEEKFKRLKDGGVNRYVYYHCGRFHDRYCPDPYIREEVMLLQLLNLFDKIAIDKIGIQDKLQAELERCRKFLKTIGSEEKIKITLSQVDIRNYAKYVLKEGEVSEKRELLLSIKSKLFLKNQQIILKK